MFRESHKSTQLDENSHREDKIHTKLKLSIHGFRCIFQICSISSMSLAKVVLVSFVCPRTMIWNYSKAVKSGQNQLKFGRDLLWKSYNVLP